jgi:hypothetical protein
MQKKFKHNVVLLRHEVLIGRLTLIFYLSLQRQTSQNKKEITILKNINAGFLSRFDFYAEKSLTRRRRNRFSEFFIRRKKNGAEERPRTMHDTSKGEMLGYVVVDFFCGNAIKRRNRCDTV